MTAEKATKLGHDPTFACFVDTRLGARFAGNDFSQFGRTEVEETQGYVIICRRQIARQ